MPPYPYQLSAPNGHRANFGLIVLQSDETLEQEARRMFDVDGVATYVSRVPSGAAVTPESLREMQHHLGGAAGLLPPWLTYDVIGYGCTSGALMIGSEQVATQVAAGAQVRHVTNPLRASLAAMEKLGVQRLAVLTPYIESVALPLCTAFEQAGVGVCGHLSFGEEKEEQVARIDPQSVVEAALHIGQDPEAEAVFLSCTNLRSFAILQELEDQLQKPVLSSNEVLFWHMGDLAGVRLNAPGWRLFQAG